MSPIEAILREVTDIAGQQSLKHRVLLRIRLTYPQRRRIHHVVAARPYDVKLWNGKEGLSAEILSGEIQTKI
jgi:hypothetical protein